MKFKLFVEILLRNEQETTKINIVNYNMMKYRNQV